jgi:hypothetical protein
MQATPSTRSPRARSTGPIDHADARAIATDPQVVRQSSHTRTTIGLLKHTAAEAAAFLSDLLADERAAANAAVGCPENIKCAERTQHFGSFVGIDTNPIIHVYLLYVIAKSTKARHRLRGGVLRLRLSKIPTLV